MDSPNPESAIRNTALNIVSRREHSRAELKQKLSRKYPESEFIERCLDWLQELSYLDDQRFAEMFVRHCVAKRRGPNRIKLEMQQKGLAAVLSDEVLQAAEVDWFELAASNLKRRFKQPVVDRKDKSKRYRYLQAQGFVGDQIQFAIAQAEPGSELYDIGFDGQGC